MVGQGGVGLGMVTRYLRLYSPSVLALEFFYASVFFSHPGPMNEEGWLVILVIGYGMEANAFA